MIPEVQLTNATDFAEILKVQYTVNNYTANIGLKHAKYSSCMKWFSDPIDLLGYSSNFMQIKEYNIATVKQL